jgi:signal peptidase II
MNGNLPPRILVLGTVALDQLTKWWALRVVPERTELPGPFSLVVVYNKGAAFGSFGTMGPLLALVGTAAAFWCLTRLATSPRSIALSLALVCGGALGNVSDRVFRSPALGRGAVVDFLSVGDFPVFNVADMAVCIGVLMLVVVSFRRTNHTI